MRTATGTPAVSALLLLGLVSGAPVSLRAAGGSSSFEAVALEAGARPAAQGEAMTASADDLAGARYNPAGLARLSRHEVSFLYSSHFEDVTAQSLGYAQPTEKWGSFGVNLFTLDYGDIPGYAFGGGRQGSVNAKDRLLRLSHGNTWRGLAYGVSLKQFQETLGSASAQGWAMDLGLLASPWDKGLFRNVSLGASALNMGGSVSFDKEKETLPGAYRLGASFKALQEALTVSADAVRPRGDKMGFALGTEYRVRDAAALRAGWRSDTGAGNGLSFGLGLKVRDIQLDYALTAFGDLGASHKVGLSFRFGGMADVYYHRGLAKMREGRYAESIMEFDKAVALEPRHERALLRLREAYGKLKEKLQQRNN